MKAKHSPAFPPAARAAHRSAGDQRQLDKALAAEAIEAIQNDGCHKGMQAYRDNLIKALAADPQVQEIAKTFAGGNPDKKLLASTSGTITALKSCRETTASWYVVYYGEGDKEVRISKNDPRRRVFDTLEAAEAWATGDSE